MLFELWYWRRLLRVPWTARRSNQTILKEISPEYLLEWLMVKLKLQYFGHLVQRTTHWKRPWCCERLKAGGEGDDRGWDGWMAAMTKWAYVWASSGRWWWKVVAEWLDAGFLASGGDEFNPRPETRLDCSELLCNKVLLKYKGDRESFWHRYQKGAKEYPPPSL